MICSHNSALASNKCIVENAKIELTFFFEDNVVSKIIYRALAPEINNPPTYRSKLKMELRENELIIKISSKDIVSLRAAINSLLRWINSITNILGEING